MLRPTLEKLDSKVDLACIYNHNLPPTVTELGIVHVFNFQNLFPSMNDLIGFGDRFRRSVIKIRCQRSVNKVDLLG